MIVKLIQTVQQFFTDLLDRPGKIIGVNKEPDYWVVKIEVAQEDEYMRKKALDDLMAIYEVHVNDDYQVIAFDRIALRERDSLECFSLNKDEDEN